ncbi:hypothetical protein WN55_11422 [Dufourea novaeangliae]|uniref:Uncharacterized protein n=1 Tax=Dufourea novaeangliae TaxID=178035 RepID=A0A154PAM4_DUFNO|nr:hypothetical protein WN55_11422 [Dufourea novaeangliae]
MHENCTPGAGSWCKWRVAETTGAAFDHPAPLHPLVQKHLLPIYKDLSENELLQRCLGRHLKNVNESFNSTVWRLAPKHLHCGIQTVEIATYIVAVVFNEGYFAILKIMDVLDIRIGLHCKQYADTYDAARVKCQDRRSFSSSKEARTAQREARASQQQFYEETEGLLYGPRIAD